MACQQAAHTCQDVHGSDRKVVIGSIAALLLIARWPSRRTFSAMLTARRASSRSGQATTLRTRGGRVQEDPRLSPEEKRLVWTDLFERPNSWLDCRPAKQAGEVPETCPDFKELKGPGWLWLSKRCPGWALERFSKDDVPQWPLWQRFDTRRFILWEELFSQPGNWVDCRAAKEAGELGGKHPDFKCSVEGDGQIFLSDPMKPVWAGERFMSGQVPEWERWGSKERGELWEMLFHEPDQWLDCRAAKGAKHLATEHPDFTQGGLGRLWLGAESTPSWVHQRLARSGAPAWTLWRKPYPKASPQLWLDLFHDTERWVDCREGKRLKQLNPQYPDFKRDDGAGLWLRRGGMPEWVPESLKMVEAPAEAQK